MFPPPILPGYEDWLAAFWELSTDRPLGFGAIGPIPARSIRDWVRDWPEEEAEAFRVCMRAMDDAFLSVTNGGQDQEPHPLRTQDAAQEAQASDNLARDAFRAAMRNKKA